MMAVYVIVIIGLIAFAAWYGPRRNAALRDANTQTCPLCASRIPKQATVCRECGRDIAPAA